MLEIPTDLKEYLKSIQEWWGGVQYLFAFPNGYGASVVRHEFSYGNNEGLWELAVLDENKDLCYDTEITHDVLGHLTNEQVSDTLRQIYGLHQRTTAKQ